MSNYIPTYLLDEVLLDENANARGRNGKFHPVKIEVCYANPEVKTLHDPHVRIRAYSRREGWEAPILLSISKHEAADLAHTLLAAVMGTTADEVVSIVEAARLGLRGKDAERLTASLAAYLEDWGSAPVEKQEPLGYLILNGDGSSTHEIVGEETFTCPTIEDLIEFRGDALVEELPHYKNDPAKVLAAFPVVACYAMPELAQPILEEYLAESAVIDAEDLL